MRVRVAARSPEGDRHAGTGETGDDALRQVAAIEVVEPCNGQSVQRLGEMRLAKEIACRGAVPPGRNSASKPGQSAVSLPRKASQCAWEAETGKPVSARAMAGASRSLRASVPGKKSSATRQQSTTAAVVSAAPGPRVGMAPVGLAPASAWPMPRRQDTSPSRSATIHTASPPSPQKCG